MTKEQICDEVQRLPHDEQMAVLQRLVEIVAPPLTAAEEQGLEDALDEADRGDVIDGPEVFAKLRAHLRGGQ